jgi:hypothetical protein
MGTGGNGDGGALFDVERPGGREPLRVDDFLNTNVEEDPAATYLDKKMQL